MDFVSLQKVCHTPLWLTLVRCQPISEALFTFHVAFNIFNTHIPLLTEEKSVWYRSPKDICGKLGAS